jgi:hypothetical protein
MSQPLTHADLKHFIDRTAFFPVGGMDSREEIAANTRVFVGDGTPYLKVPGLQRVQDVRLSGLSLPPKEIREFPADASLTRLLPVENPLYGVQAAADGTPILLRNRTSNDGIWQEGERVYVTGEWDAEVAAPPVPETDPKKKASPLITQRG